MRCFGLLVYLLHISPKTADDIVENNDQVILAGLEAETLWVIGTYDNDYNKKFWQDQGNFFWLCWFEAVSYTHLTLPTIYSV